jgi:hypothetical protein
MAMAAIARNLLQALARARARLRLRLRADSPIVSLFARLRALRLDHELAEGVAPWRSAVHAARALQVTSDRKRLRLARTLERLVAEADIGPAADARPAPRIGPCCEQILLARGDILALADRLRAPVSIDAGVAVQLRRLVSDGAGPLYTQRAPRTLRATLDPLLDALDVPD